MTFTEIKLFKQQQPHHSSKSLKCWKTGGKRRFQNFAVSFFLKKGGCFSHGMCSYLCLSWPCKKYMFFSFTANSEQFYNCHSPWFKDAPYWPSNRHSSSDSTACDSSQTQAKWTITIWRCLAFERRSKCMWHPLYHLTTTPQSLFHLIILTFFFTLIVFHVLQQKPESNEQRQNGLKMVDQAIWSKKMSNGVRRTPVSAEQVCSVKWEIIFAYILKYSYTRANWFPCMLIEKKKKLKWRRKVATVISKNLNIRWLSAYCGMCAFICWYLESTVLLIPDCVYVCVCVKARAYNCQIRSAVLDSSSRVKWTNTTHHPTSLVGEEVSVCACIPL